MTKIAAEHLARTAYVHIRQSTPGQLVHNQESRDVASMRSPIARDSLGGRAWRSSTMIWVVQAVVPPGQALTA